MRIIFAFLMFSFTAAAQDIDQQTPGVDEILARMAEHDAQRAAALQGYTATRRYLLQNENHHKRAEMFVTVRCHEDGSKEFETLAESGWGGARKYVFPKLLKSETAASMPGEREKSRIAPDNYSFQFLRTDRVNDRPAYVLAITPKAANQYLIRGTIWVDASDYAIARIEGAPAKNPSFWTKSVHFTHTYEKKESFWLPVCDRSVTEARIFGATELTIDYFDYSLNHLATLASNATTTTAGINNR
jgi:outer membrane lipoprotein-sorting protein